MTATARLVNDIHHKIVINNPINVSTVQPVQADTAIYDFNESLGGVPNEPIDSQGCETYKKSVIYKKSLIQQT